MIGNFKFVLLFDLRYFLCQVSPNYVHIDSQAEYYVVKYV